MKTIAFLEFVIMTIATGTSASLHAPLFGANVRLLRGVICDTHAVSMMSETEPKKKDPITADFYSQEEWMCILLYILKKVIQATRSRFAFYSWDVFRMLTVTSSTRAYDDLIPHWGQIITVACFASHFVFTSDPITLIDTPIKLWVFKQLHYSAEFFMGFAYAVTTTFSDHTLLDISHFNFYHADNDLKRLAFSTGFNDTFNVWRRGLLRVVVDKIREDFDDFKHSPCPIYLEHFIQSEYPNASDPRFYFIDDNEYTDKLSAQAKATLHVLQNNEDVPPFVHRANFRSVLQPGINIFNNKQLYKELYHLWVSLDIKKKLAAQKELTEKMREEHATAQKKSDELALKNGEQLSEVVIIRDPREMYTEDIFGISTLFNAMANPEDTLWDMRSEDQPIKQDPPKCNMDLLLEALSPTTAS